jgi:hypothetical protein
LAGVEWALTCRLLGFIACMAPNVVRCRIVLAEQDRLVLSCNACRLIDALRSTVRCKAHRIYLDAAQENPPKQLGWR